MEVKINEISSVEKELLITVPSQTVDEKFDAVYKKIGKTAKIKGFRPGKAPKHILKKSYYSVIMEELYKDIINETYYKAISDNDLLPITHPSISPKELKEGEPFEYSAKIETKPALTQLQIKGLNFTKEKLTIPEEMINNELKNIQNRHSTTTLIENPDTTVDKGHITTIDFEGFLEDGTLIKGGKAQDHTLEIGSNQFIPGFEEGLLGMKANEEKDINVKFPDDYGSSDLKGANAKFHVKLKEIKEKKLPPLDDEFAKSAGNLDTLDEFKTKIKEDIKKHKEDNIMFKLKQNIAKKLLEINEFEAPPSIVEEQKKRLMEDTQKRLAHLGKDNVNAYINENENQFKSQAISNVKLFFLFEEIAKQENLSVSKEDLDQEIDKMAEASSKSTTEIKDYYKKHNLLEDLKYKIKEDKIYNLVLENSTVEEKEPEEKID